MKYPARIVIWPKMKSSSPEPEQSWVSGWYFTLGRSLYSDSPWFTPRPDKPIWRFPGMGVPPNHLFLMGLSIVKPSSYWGTPFSGNSHLRATYRPETPQRIMHSLPPHGAHVRRTGEIDTDGAIARLLDASCTVGSTIYSLRWIIVIMFYLFIYIYIWILCIVHVIDGSFEIKLPTICTDEAAEVGTVFMLPLDVSGVFPWDWAHSANGKAVHVPLFGGPVLVAVWRLGRHPSSFKSLEAACTCGKQCAGISVEEPT